MRTVIIFIANMMDNFFMFKITPNTFFNYKSVLKDIILFRTKRVRRDKELNISITFPFSTIPVWIAFSKFVVTSKRTIFLNSDLNTVRRCSKFPFASNAINKSILNRGVCSANDRAVFPFSYLNFAWLSLKFISTGKAFSNYRHYDLQIKRLISACLEKTVKSLTHTLSQNLNIKNPPFLSNFSISKFRTFASIAFILLIPLNAYAQFSGSPGPFPGSGGTFITISTVAGLPSSPATNDLALITDGNADDDCTSGTGSNINMCVYNGSAWVIIGDGGGGGGSSEWTDTGTVLHPTDSSGTLDNVVVGGTTQAGADIILNVDGSFVANEQGNSVDFRVEGNTVTDLFVVDGSDDDVEINGGLNINLPADDSVVIDGATNNRTIDTGALQINQTPGIENTRAITINLDINSQATSHSQVTNIVATGLAPGETATAYDTNVDRSTSTGGVVRGYEMSIAGAGTAVGHLIHADPGIVPLTQFSGVFINVEQAWDENGGFADVTTAFNTSNPGGANNVTLFNANADMVHIGMATAFNEIEVNLETFAGGAGIKPVFEYSSGGGTPVWTVFTPQDETQGFRQTGLIDWSIDDLVTPTWAAATINSVSKLYIRITRTQASIPTDPKEDTIQVVKAAVYFWNADGKVFSGSLATGNRSTTITTEGSAETSQMIAHIDDSFSETIEHTLMRHSDTAGLGAILYAIRSNGTHASQTTVADNDVIFQLKVAGHDGTDYNDLASIFFEVDGGVSGNDMPGRIVFKTSADGGNTLGEALRIDNAKQSTFAGIIADLDDMVFEVDSDDNGSNEFIWTDGASTIIATLNEAGAFQIADDMIVSGGDVTLSGTGVKLSGASGVFMQCGIGGSNNECLSYDFETTSNLITISSDSGATIVNYKDDFAFGWGDFGEARLVWETTGNDSFQIGLNVGSTSFTGYMSLMENSDLGNANRSPLATSADPVFRVYSSDATQALDYIEMFHDQTEGILRVGGGDLDIEVASQVLNIKPTTGAGNAMSLILRDDGNNTLMAFKGSTDTDQLVWVGNDGSGNQIVLATVLGADYDHALQTNPTLFIQSDINPGVSNNQWGSLHHDQEDFIIETGVNIGTGSAPTTDDNSIILAPRGVEQFKVEGGGGTTTTGTATSDGFTVGQDEFFISGTSTLTFNGTDWVFANDVVVPADPYNATTWNGNQEAAPKDAVRDKIEALSGPSGYQPFGVSATRLSGNFVVGDPAINAGASFSMLLDTDSDDGFALTPFVMPAGYITDTLDIVVTYSMSDSNCDGSTTVVGIEVDIMALADGESAETASFDTANDVTNGTVCPGTVDLRDTITFTNVNDDGLASGETLIIRVNRDIDDDDDAADDVQILTVHATWNN